MKKKPFESSPENILVPVRDHLQFYIVLILYSGNSISLHQHTRKKKKDVAAEMNTINVIRSWEPANVPLFSYIIFNPIDFRLHCPSRVYIRFFSPAVHRLIYISLTLLARLRVCVNVYTAGTVMYIPTRHISAITRPIQSIDCCWCTTATCRRLRGPRADDVH